MKEYIACFSGGKDSGATIAIAKEMGEPLNKIIFSEVMYDENTSGELPEHIAFINEVCKPLFESWGYEFITLRSEMTYIKNFYQVRTKSKIEERNGKYKGFPMAGACEINSRCKIKPIKDYIKKYKPEEIIQYVGIAADESKRLERIRGTNEVSLLEKYNITEQQAREICEKYGILSPVYNYSKRGGCWFCPNARDTELKHLRKNHSRLWGELMKLEEQENIIGKVFDSRNKRSIHGLEEKYRLEEAQMTIFDFL